MRVVIIDDEPFARDELAFLLDGLPRIEVVGFACDGIEAEPLIARTQPDVVFCDIEMPGINGLALAKSLQTQAMSWVFVTAYDNHAHTAFDLHAADYLVKPVEPERLLACIERLRTRHKSPKHQLRSERLVSKIGDRNVVINRSNLRYIHNDGKHVNLVANETSHSHESFKALINLACLIQCHPHYAINTEHVREVEYGDNGDALLLLGDDRVPVSRRYLPIVQKALGIN